ncbi:MAG: FliM/FliN family flagellar motor switch protein [Alphaproteobacteria bacterium]|nr:FliM/FliN family flagellar motor switch protein [Alphaproteobacteria bacterium]
MAVKDLSAYSSGDINVKVSITLGSANLRVYQLLRLGRGAVVELDRNVNDDVDIYADNVLIGHGEVIVTDDDNIGISVTKTQP